MTEDKRPGESVREMLAERSTERALSNLNRLAESEPSEALKEFLKKKRANRRRPWK
jgi:hypothetical protein